MQLKSKAALGSLLVTTMATAAVALPSAAQAAQPGDLCTLGGIWVGAGNFGQVFAEPLGYTLLYQLSPGASFRVAAYASNNMYLGHGNGHADGYMSRDFVVQSSCHQ